MSPAGSHSSRKAVQNFGIENFIWWGLIRGEDHRYGFFSKTRVRAQSLLLLNFVFAEDSLACVSV